MSQGQFSNAQINNVASGGLEVPISPFATAAKLFSSGLGAYEQNKANSAEDDLTTQKAADQKANLSALTDALAGPSNMQTPTNPNAPAVGATTTFDQPGASPVAQQQTDPNAQPVEMNQKRAALAAILKNTDPAVAQQMLMGPAMAKFGPPKTITAADGADVLSQNPMDGSITKVFENPKDLKPSADDRALINVVDPNKKGGYNTIKREDFQPGMQLYQKPDSATILAGQLNGNALDDAATKYRLTGELPANRSGGLSVKIMNRAADMSDAAGDSSTARTIRQKAGAQAVTDLKTFEKQSTLVTAAEKNASKAADVLETLAPKVDNTNNSTWNRWVQGGRKLTGVNSPDLKALNDQIETFVPEYAKVMSGSLGNSAASDTAANHARTMIGMADTPAEFAKELAILRLDMANRIKSQGEQRSDLYGAIGNGGQAQIPGAGVGTPNAAPGTVPATTGAHPAAILGLLDKYK